MFLELLVRHYFGFKNRVDKKEKILSKSHWPTLIIGWSHLSVALIDGKKSPKAFRPLLWVKLQLEDYKHHENWNVLANQNSISIFMTFKISKYYWFFSPSMRARDSSDDLGKAKVYGNFEWILNIFWNSSNINIFIVQNRPWMGNG